MVAHIEIGSVELAVLGYYQNQVVAVELAQVGTSLVIVQTVHIVVEPHFTSA